MIEQIYNYEGAYNLFKSHNCVGNDNCIFFGLIDSIPSKSDIATAVLAKSTSGLIGGSATYIPGSEYKYQSFLFNFTENGVGIIALNNKEKNISLKINKMEIVNDSFIFIKKEDIKSIKCKRIKGVSRYVNVAIELRDDSILKLRVNIKDNYLTYQESNFKYFLSKYKIDSSNILIYLIILFVALLTLLIIAITSY